MSRDFRSRPKSIRIKIDNRFIQVNFEPDMDEGGTIVSMKAIIKPLNSDGSFELQNGDEKYFPINLTTLGLHLDDNTFKQYITQEVRTILGLPPERKKDNKKQEVTEKEEEKHPLSHEEQNILSQRWQLDKYRGKIKSGEQVTKINLVVEYFSEDDFRFLAEIIENSDALQDVTLLGESISKANEKGMEIIFAALAKKKNLQKLDLRFYQIGDAGAIRLARVLKAITGLKYLYLSSCNIGDAGMEHLSSSLPYNANLQILHLDDNIFGINGLTSLIERLNKTNLEILNLIGNAIGDVGATKIAEALYKNNSLTNLILSPSSIDARHLKSIEENLRLNNEYPLILHDDDTPIFEHDNHLDLIKLDIGGEDTFEELVEKAVRLETAKGLKAGEALKAGNARAIEYLEYRILGIINPDNTVTEESLDKLAEGNHLLSTLSDHMKSDQGKWFNTEENYGIDDVLFRKGVVIIVRQEIKKLKKEISQEQYKESLGKENKKDKKESKVEAEESSSMTTTQSSVQSSSASQLSSSSLSSSISKDKDVSRGT